MNENVNNAEFCAVVIFSILLSVKKSMVSFVYNRLMNANTHINREKTYNSHKMKKKINQGQLVFNTLLEISKIYIQFCVLLIFSSQFYYNIEVKIRIFAQNVNNESK